MIKFSEEYPGRAANPSNDYPDGTFQDVVTGVPNSGTPLQQTWARDIDGFSQAMVHDFIWRTGNPDTATNSQRMLGLEHRFGRTTRPPQSGLDKICSGLISADSNQWHESYSAPNYFGPTSDWVDSCIGVDYITSRPCIFAIQSNNVIVKVSGLWQYNSSIKSEGSIDITYPSTPSHVVSICCEGDYLYVAWRDSVSETYKISKFSANPNLAYGLWGRIWTVDTGHDYEGILPYQVYYPKLIVANQSSLALSLEQVIDNGVSRQGVAIIQKNSGTLFIGHGGVSLPAGPGYPMVGRLVSDQEHVFWIQRIESPSVTSYIRSAKISDPKTSDYTLNKIGPTIDPSTNRLEIPCSIINLGGRNGVVLIGTPDGQIYQFVKSENEVTYCKQINGFIPAMAMSRLSTIMGFDGLNVWAHFVQTNPRYLDASISFAKIPANIFGRNAATPSDAHIDIDVDLITTPITQAYDSVEAGRLLYDGKDMIFCCRSGSVMRITNTTAR